MKQHGKKKEKLIKMKKSDLQAMLCSRFCQYYRPDKDEELACQGFLVTAELIRRHKRLRFPAEMPKNPAPDIHEDLIRHVCDFCPFHEHDCDFYEHRKGVSPCGGLIFLGMLLAEQLVTVDNIKDIR